MEENNRKVIDMFPEKQRVEELKRKLDVVKGIVINRTLAQIEDPKTFMIAGAAGLWQGMKYKGSLSLGLKGAAASLGVMIGVNVANGLVQDMDKIKRA